MRVEINEDDIIFMPEENQLFMEFIEQFLDRSMGYARPKNDRTKIDSQRRMVIIDLSD